MPRSIDATFEAPVTVARVHAAFGDRRYWLARLAAFGGGITLDSLLLDPTGAVTVSTTQDLRHDALPSLLAKVYPGDLTIRRDEAWTPIDPGTVAGDIKLTAIGAPLSGSASALLAATGGGSRLTLTGSLQVKLPLLGGKIENFLAGQLIEGIAEILRFTVGWLAENSADRRYQ